MLNEEQIAIFRAEGIGYVCSMCVKMHDGRDRGLPGCTGQDCRGPFANGNFREYQGPLTRDMMASVCFVCGETAVIQLKPKVNPLAKTLGICEKHRPLLEKLKAVKRVDAPTT